MSQMVNKIRKQCKSRHFLGCLTLCLFLLILIIPAHAKAIDPVVIEPACKVLKNTSGGMGKEIKDMWQLLLNFVNGFVILVLIFVAFAQILRLNINTYGVKKILPALVFAIIAANFSFLFCRLLVDVANILISYFLTNTGAGGAIIGASSGSFSSASWASPATQGVQAAMNTTSPNYGVIFWFVIAQFLVFAAGIIILILAFLFFVRLWLIYFLVALAPIAFMATVLPQTKKLFSEWWTNFSKWVFMPVISVFWLWLGAAWLNVLKVSVSGDNAFVLTFIFSGVCFYLAITTPFKAGGAIMGQWSKLGKGAGKFGYNQWGGAASRLSAYGQRLEQRNKGTRLGNFGALLNKAGGVANAPANINAYKQARKESKENLEKAAKKTGTYNRMLGPRGQFNALQEILKDDYDQKSATETGRDQATLEKSMLPALQNGNTRQAKLFAQNHKGVNMGNAAQVVEALRGDLSTMGADKLMDSYGGIGGLKTAKDAVEAKLNTRKYKQSLNQRQRSALNAGYNNLLSYTTPSGLVTNPHFNPTPTGGPGPFFGTSGVGQTTQATMANHISTLQQIPGGGGILQAVMTPGGNVASAYKEALKQSSPEQRRALQESAQAVKKVLNEWMAAELEQREKTLEETLGQGFSVLKSAKNLNMTGGISNINNQLDQMANESAPELRVAAQRATNNAKSALQKMAESGALVPDSGPLDLDSVRKKIMENESSKIRLDVQTEAKANVGGGLATNNFVNQMAANPAIANMPVGSLAESSHALEALNANMEQLAHTLSTHGEGGSITQIAKIDPDSINAKGIIGDAVQGSISDMGMKVSDALKSSDFKMNLADGVKRGIMQASTQIKPAVQPIPPIKPKPTIPTPPKG